MGSIFLEEVCKEFSHPMFWRFLQNAFQLIFCYLLFPTGLDKIQSKNWQTFCLIRKEIGK
jgi:hypothetical protein